MVSLTSAYYRQLTHPLVSPVFQGSLGNLCPLYIIAGDNECLRDEIIYLAHRAAYPEEFPPRKEAAEESCRQAENVKKFKTPTKVHLQVFDGAFLCVKSGVKKEPLKKCQGCAMS